MASKDSTSTSGAAETADQTTSAKPAGENSSAAFLEGTLDSAHTEDSALALLKRGDLGAEALEQLSKVPAVRKSRKAWIALVQHPRTPRHVSLPMLRHLLTFDLMKLALAPAVPADVKIAAEQTLITRLESVALGERLSLARRASGRVAGALLDDVDAKVVLVALENARLTEASVVKALMRNAVPTALVQAASHHSKWSLRREVRIALLRNEKTPMARALEFGRSLPPALVREVLQSSRLPAKAKAYLMKELEDGQS